MNHGFYFSIKRHLRATLKGSLFIALFIALSNCSDKPQPPEVKLKPAPTLPPTWAKEAIWYQIMVERFHNGDVTNDPVTNNIEGSYPDNIPPNWSLTPWTQNWHKADAYFTDVSDKNDFTGKALNDFEDKTTLRRYGGDLQGVLDKLDYLSELGVNAIYFNAINDAPSAHKYDASHWRHVDVNFGPDPKGDLELIEDETPDDPSTWVMSSADKLFLQVIKAAKVRQIRIILDYSWHHTGHKFWAWQDVLKNQKTSEYADWYRIKNFDDADTPENEFEFSGWRGAFGLPEIQETSYTDHSALIAFNEGDIKSQAAKDHILSVTRRWLDPNGDGDPSDGVDGFRLDAAADLPLGFWRDYRIFVKSINPEAYIVGDIRWQKRPDEMLDPKAVLQGDIFDAVTNYRWYREARHFFASAPNTLKVSEFVQRLRGLQIGISEEFNQSMMNMSASHDSPRLLTSVFNNNKYKNNAKPSKNPTYKSNKPDVQAVNIAKLLLVHQFTYIGAPQIWAGDEMGMWGSDAPHNRKPLTWPEFTFEDELTQITADRTIHDAVRFNQDLFDYYQFLVKLRRANPVLSSGKLEFLEVNDSKQLLSYRRYNDKGKQVFVMFNQSNKTHRVIMPLAIVNSAKWQVWRASEGLNILPLVPSEHLSIAANSVVVIVVD